MFLLKSDPDTCSCPLEQHTLGLFVENPCPKQYYRMISSIHLCFCLSRTHTYSHTQTHTLRMSSYLEYQYSTPILMNLISGVISCIRHPPFSLALSIVENWYPSFYLYKYNIIDKEYNKISIFSH